jgi:hypothetical protein
LTSPRWPGNCATSGGATASLAEQDLTARLAAAGYDPQAVADTIARYEGADTINIDGVQYYVPAAIGYELSTAAR